MSASRGAFFSGTTNPKPPGLTVSVPTTRFMREGRPTRAPRIFTTSPLAIIARRTPFSSRRASASSPSRFTISRTPTGFPVSISSVSTRSRNGASEARDFFSDGFAGLATETQRHRERKRQGNQKRSPGTRTRTGTTTTS